MLSHKNHNPDVLSCLANLSADEIFTPPSVANQMLDLLPDKLWRDETVTFLDPCCKSGVFLREIAKRLIEGLKQKIPNKQERINHIFHKQLYGIAITQLTSLIARRSLYCSKDARGKYSVVENFLSSDGNIRYNDKAKHSWHNGRCKFCGASQAAYDRDDDMESHAYEFIHTHNPKEIFNMKFDVIVGNPPYQLDDGGNSVSATPIFQHFVRQAKKLTPRFLSMIIPSRWYAGGKGLDEFRQEMLNDKRISRLVDFESSKNCFPGVNIAGGVCYFLWENEYDDMCEVTNLHGNSHDRTRRFLSKFSVFIRSNKAVSIVEKVTSMSSEMMDNFVLPRNPFGFATNFRGNEKRSDGDIAILSSQGLGYVSKDSVTKNISLIDKHKVLIGRLVPSNGELNVNPVDGYRVITDTKILRPNEISTESYIVIGSFDNEAELSNFNEYINLKFPRFLLRQAISSVNVTRDCFAFVPVLDFQEKWTDYKLYKKFALTNDEIEFVEKTIRSR